MKFIFKFFLILLLYTYTYSTQYRYRSFETELSEIPHLVSGVVVSKKVQLSEDIRREKKIFTYYRFKVEEVLRGDIRLEEISVRTPGGTLLGREEVVSGGAQLDVDQRVVLFLASVNSDKSYNIFGLRNGVVQYEADGETLIGPLISGDNSAQVESQWNSKENRQSHDGTANNQVWTLRRIKDYYRDQENTKRNNELSNQSSELNSKINNSKNSALPLQNTGSQAQIMESATHSLAEGEDALSVDQEEQKKGATYKMDLILPILIGFFIILVIPFILYQILRKRPD